MEGRLGKFLHRQTHRGGKERRRDRRKREREEKRVKEGGIGDDKIFRHESVFVQICPWEKDRKS